MITYPNINPIALELGPLAIRWYGVMYVLGFLGAFGLAYYRGKRQYPRPWTFDEVADLVFYCALGVIFGGTLGFLLFYDPTRILHDPLSILKFWEPGRSFHGGLLGVVLAVYFFGRAHGRRFLEIGDIIAPAVPIGLATGRIGNFINGELWGRVTTAPWGVVFPNAGLSPRHPSQLYEFILEGIVLCTILFLLSLKKPKEGVLTALFLILYGVFRSFVEFFREPDQNIGFILGDILTTGQALSFPMIVAGLILLYYANRGHRFGAATT